MESFIFFTALFLFMFGSVIALRCLEFGLRVGDKALEHSGTICKQSIVISFKLIVFSLKVLFYVLSHLLRRIPVLKDTMGTAHIITPALEFKPALQFKPALKLKMHQLKQLTHKK